MTIGDNIKKYRRENKLTQQGLGDLVNKSAISIRKYEANAVKPSIMVLIEIASALNVGIEDLTNQNEIDYSKELNVLNNQMPLLDKSDSNQLELLYTSKLDHLKNII